MRHRVAVQIGIVAASLGLVGCQGSEEDNGPVQAAPAPRAASVKHQGVQTSFPSAKRTGAAGGVTRLYGPALATGASADESAEQFRKRYVADMGIQDGELVPRSDRQAKAAASASPAVGLMVDRTTGQPKFWLYRYTQNKAGVPVYGAGLRTLVRNDAKNEVVWAASTVRALGDFALPAGAQGGTPDLDKSLRAIPAVAGLDGGPLSAPKSIAKVSAPELVVFAGTEDKEVPPRMAIQYTVDTLPSGSWRFVADAATGDVLHVESMISYANVNGSVSGNATQGDVAMECATSAARSMPDAEVSGSAGEFTFTDDAGNFVLPTSSTGAVDVTSSMGGRFFDVTNFAGPTETIVQSVVPPGPATFLHNAGDTDEARAQVNAYLALNELRHFVLEYIPTYPEIATEVNFPLNVNLSNADNWNCPGNAWYSWSNSISFCQAGTNWQGRDITNAAFASIAHHEYTHRLIQAAGSGQGAYGEGMADSVAVLFSGLHGFGYGWELNQCATPDRDALNTCQFDPDYCSSCAVSPPPPIPPGEIHYCGPLLSGTIWDIRIALSVTNPSTYVDLINELTLNSILLHTGSLINDQIAVDMLTLDDDDGNLNNGTPHRTEICIGFAQHGMPCAPLPPNTAPVVNAGPDQTITLPAAATLSGTVSDDGLPDPPGQVTTTWSRVSGPTGGTVVFANPSALTTTATFSMAGTYVLRLTANDGALSGQDDLVVTVNPPAGPCGGLCPSPVRFSIAPYRDYQSGNLGTGSVCYETTSPIVGGNCGNFLSPRTLSVNGVVKTCNYQNWSTMPAPRNGGYCIQTTTGNYPYAYFSVWRGAQ